MGELARKMVAATSKPQIKKALLVLEDGTAFYGTACGAAGETFGEICFNTSIEGYLEIATDPSYAGQIVVMTYPQIGNYGVCLEDVQAEHPALRALVVRDMCFRPSNWRSELTFPEYLRREGVVAIEGIDTRALVRHVRDCGAMRAGVSTEDLDVASLLAKVKSSPSIVGVNLARTVSCKQPYPFTAEGVPVKKAFALVSATPARYRVVAYDCGVKRSILEGLVRAGCEVLVVPWDTPASEVLAQNPDGVFLSNGPGDPDAVRDTYEQVQVLLGNVPIFGICLGHQMICKAAGARMEKLKFGHHGGNQPVVNLLTGRVEITAQNHGFNLVFPSLGEPANESENVFSTHFQNAPACWEHIAENESKIRSLTHFPDCTVVDNPRYGRIRLTHVNLNDGTAEGVAFMGIPAFSVQYHPEASPGPTDSHYLFTAFTRLMDGRNDYLDIDIAQDRLEGWRF